MNFQQKIRAFIGLPISQRNAMIIQNSILAIQKSRNLTHIKWIKPENWHITLRFLGHIPVQTIPSLKDELEKIIAKTSPFELSLKSINFFPPSASKPHCLVINVSLTEPLAKLFHHINVMCENIGFAPDTHPFLPHITLGKLQSFHPVQIPPTSILPVIEKPEHVILYESKTDTEGSHYIPLVTFEFN